MFGAGSRDLQDKFNGRAVADRIVENVESSVFTDEYRKFVEAAEFFFLATSSGEITDCSFKGGAPGFVQVIAPDRLIFPDYDGNRMYKSLGNIVDNPNIGMFVAGRQANRGSPGTAHLPELPSLHSANEPNFWFALHSRVRRAGA